MLALALRSVVLKLRRSPVWLPLVLAAGIAILKDLTIVTHSMELPPGMSAWGLLLATLSTLYGVLLLPLAVVAIAGLVCRTEHLAGGWRQGAPLPMSRGSVFWATFLVVALVAVVQGLSLAGLAVDGSLFVSGAGGIPWGMLLDRMALSWLAYIPIAALQLGLGAALPNFGAQLAIGAMLTIPGVVAAHTVYAPYYFWVQSALLISGAAGTLGRLPIYISGSAALILLLGAWIFLVRRDVA